MGVNWVNPVNGSGTFCYWGKGNLPVLYFIDWVWDTTPPVPGGFAVDSQLKYPLVNVCRSVPDIMVVEH